MANGAVPGGPVSRWFDRWVRSLTLHQAGRRHSPATTLFDAPEPDERVLRTARLAALFLAVLGPVLVCLAMVAVRDDIERSTAALVLVLPVVLVAVVGGPAPSAISAVVAALAFDVLLTRPYYRFEMHATEDVEAALILLVVGLVVGQLVAREVRSRVRSATRGAELDALVAAVTSATRTHSEVDLTEQTVAALVALLDLRRARYSPGYHGTAHAVLTRDGELSGVEGGATPDRAPLPHTGVELPVVAGDNELGRLILIPAGPTPVSLEERRVAVAIADVFALALAERSRA